MWICSTTHAAPTISESAALQPSQAAPASNQQLPIVLRFISGLYCPVIARLSDGSTWECRTQATCRQARSAKPIPYNSARRCDLMPTWLP